jgi:hypothetical protein
VTGRGVLHLTHFQVMQMPHLGTTPRIKSVCCHQCSSSQLRWWCHSSSLTQTINEISTPRQSADTTNQGSMYFSDGCLDFKWEYQYNLQQTATHTLRQKQLINTDHTALVWKRARGEGWTWGHWRGCRLYKINTGQPHKSTLPSWAWWCMLVIPATGETEAEESPG